jgi:hypothetical protein
MKVLGLCDPGELSAIRGEQVSTRPIKRITLQDLLHVVLQNSSS